MIVNYVPDRAGAERGAEEIEAAGGKTAIVGASVTRLNEIDRLFAEIKKRFGKVDILVNNAGVFGRTRLESLESEFDRQFNTNVKGLLFTTNAALPPFGVDGGSVINTVP